MKKEPAIHHFTLSPTDNERLFILTGPQDEHLNWIEQEMAVRIQNRGHQFTIKGKARDIEKASRLIQALYQLTLKHNHFSPSFIENMAQSIQKLPSEEHAVLPLKNDKVQPRTTRQGLYLEAIEKYRINFGIGPAGTGKTFLAVASAVMALEKELINRIVLVRPAVEAGENLGFLPGDLAEKIDPYLRPLYDSLYDLIGKARTHKLIDQGLIEIAPLAYMRGRTLNDAFIILDEAQNTTSEQMKMFLTRMGFGSRIVITGDVTQVDLPKKQVSGLQEAIKVLQDIQGIYMCFFTAEDVVRHPLVQKIIEAYAKVHTNHLTES